MSNPRVEGLPVLFRMLNAVSESGALSFRRCPDGVLSSEFGLNVAQPRRGTLVLFCGVSERDETRDTHESPEEAFSNGNCRKMNGQG